MTERNGASKDGASSGLHQNRVERAEHMVEHLGERVGQTVTRVTSQLSRWAARAREELEDIVAEAQSLRRGDPPQ